MRVKTGTVRTRRHKRLLKQARGFYSGRRKHFRKAKEQLERSLVYAYRDRRQKKRDFRRLWIVESMRLQDWMVWIIQHSCMVLKLQILNLTEKF